MKKVIFLACILAMAACGPAKKTEQEKAKTSLEIRGLRGAVRSVLTSTVTYDYEQDEMGTPRKGSELMESFDSRGMLTESVETRENGDYEYRMAAKYDADNHLTELTTTTADRVHKIVYEYKDGKPVSQKFYDGEGTYSGGGTTEIVSPEVENYIFHDKDGRKAGLCVKTYTSPTDYTMENIVYDDNGGEASRTIQTYSGDLLLETKETVAGADGQAREIVTKHTYDDSGKITGTVTTGNGETTENIYMKYQYDDLGNWYQQFIFDAATDRLLSVVDRDIRF